VNLFKFSFRNVIRYRTRTIYSSLSIFIASMIVVFAQGYVSGISNSMMESYRDYITGDFRITTEGFVKRENLLPVDEIIDPSIISILDTIEGIEHIEPRFRFGTLIGKNENTEQGIGVGLDIENTRYRLKERIVDGEISRGILISREFAKKIDINLGDSVLIVAKTSEGGINGIKLRVSGLIFFGIGMLDRNMFFIPIDDARKLLKIKDGFTEIMVFVKDKKATERIKSLKIKGLSIREPGEQIPFLKYFNAVVKIYSLLEIFICLLASFVILNLMTMIVFERTREIGTLKALGMKDSDIFLNFVIEGTIIGSFGSITGSIAGYFLTMYLAQKGINFEGAIKNTDLVISYVIYPDAKFSFLIISFFMATIVSTIASIVPALYTKRFTPYEALRKV